MFVQIRARDYTNELAEDKYDEKNIVKKNVDGYIIIIARKILCESIILLYII